MLIIRIINIDKNRILQIKQLKIIKKKLNNIFKKLNQSLQDCMNSHNYELHHQQSDDQTVTQTQTIQQPIVTLQYLLNQNKMKQIALSKATHLIELYKIELQVKQQDYAKQLQNIKETQSQKYQSLVTELQEKIIHLEKKIKHYQNKIKQLENKQVEYPQMAMLNQSGLKMSRQSINRIPRLIKNSSNKELSKDKKATGRWSHKKNAPSNHGPNPMKRSLSTLLQNQPTKQQQIYRLQKTFLIQYLLKSQQKDDKIFSLFQNQLQIQSQSINQKLYSIKANDKQTEYFIKSLKQSCNHLENRNKQYKEVIKIQELIIEEFNRQGMEYQTLFEIMESSLNQVFEKGMENSSDFYQSRLIQTTQTIINSGNIFQHFTDSMHMTQQNITRRIKNHKNFIKDKIANMQNENKQLKRILDDMIKLIKSNKKMQMASYGSIRTNKNNQQFNLPQTYKSSLLIRK